MVKVCSTCGERDYGYGCDCFDNKTNIKQEKQELKSRIKKPKKPKK